MSSCSWRATLALAVAAACAPHDPPCGEEGDFPLETAAVQDRFVSLDTSHVRFRARHGLERRDSTWMPRRLVDPAACRPVHEALRAWMDTVAARTPEGRRPRTDDYAFRVYQVPGHYVVTLDALDGGELSEGYGTMLFLRAEDLVLVDSVLF